MVRDELAKEGIPRRCNVDQYTNYLDEEQEKLRRRLFKGFEEVQAVISGANSKRSQQPPVSSSPPGGNAGLKPNKTHKQRLFIQSSEDHEDDGESTDGSEFAICEVYAYALHELSKPLVDLSVLPDRSLTSISQCALNATGSGAALSSVDRIGQDIDFMFEDALDHLEMFDCVDTMATCDRGGTPHESAQCGSEDIRIVNLRDLKEGHLSSNNDAPNEQTGGFCNSTTQGSSLGANCLHHEQKSAGCDPLVQYSEHYGSHGNGRWPDHASVDEGVMSSEKTAMSNIGSSSEKTANSYNESTSDKTAMSNAASLLGVPISSDLHGESGKQVDDGASMPNDASKQLSYQGRVDVEGSDSSCGIGIGTRSQRTASSSSPCGNTLVLDDALAVTGTSISETQHVRNDEGSRQLVHAGAWDLVQSANGCSSSQQSAARTVTFSVDTYSPVGITSVSGTAVATNDQNLEASNRMNNASSSAHPQRLHEAHDVQAIDLTTQHDHSAFRHSSDLASTPTRGLQHDIINSLSDDNLHEGIVNNQSVLGSDTRLYREGDSTNNLTGKSTYSQEVALVSESVGSIQRRYEEYDGLHGASSSTLASNDMSKNVEGSSSRGKLGSRANAQSSELGFSYSHVDGDSCHGVSNAEATHGDAYNNGVVSLIDTGMLSTSDPVFGDGSHSGLSSGIDALRGIANPTQRVTDGQQMISSSPQVFDVRDCSSLASRLDTLQDIANSTQGDSDSHQMISSIDQVFETRDHNSARISDQCATTDPQMVSVSSSDQFLGFSRYQSLDGIDTLRGIADPIHCAVDGQMMTNSGRSCMASNGLQRAAVEGSDLDMCALGYPTDIEPSTSNVSCAKLQGTEDVATKSETNIGSRQVSTHNQMSHVMDSNQGAAAEAIFGSQSDQFIMENLATSLNATSNKDFVGQAIFGYQSDRVVGQSLEFTMENCVSNKGSLGATMFSSQADHRIISHETFDHEGASNQVLTGEDVFDYQSDKLVMEKFEFTMLNGVLNSEGAIFGSQADKCVVKGLESTVWDGASDNLLTDEAMFGPTSDGFVEEGTHVASDHLKGNGSEDHVGNFASRETPTSVGFSNPLGSKDNLHDTFGNFAKNVVESNSDFHSIDYMQNTAYFGHLSSHSSGTYAARSSSSRQDPISETATFGDECGTYDDRNRGINQIASAKAESIDASVSDNSKLESAESKPHWKKAGPLADEVFIGKLAMILQQQASSGGRYPCDVSFDERSFIQGFMKREYGSSRTMSRSHSIGAAEGIHERVLSHPGASIPAVGYSSRVVPKASLENSNDGSSNRRVSPKLSASNSNSRGCSRRRARSDADGLLDRARARMPSPLWMPLAQRGIPPVAVPKESCPAPAKTKGQGKGSPPKKAPPPKKAAPPPPPKKGLGKGNGSTSPAKVDPAKPDVKPTVPMKKLFWHPIRLRDGGNSTIWGDIGEKGAAGANIDISELEEQFSDEIRRRPGTPINDESKPKIRKIQVLDEQRRRQICVMLAKLPDHQVLRGALMAMDKSKLDRDQVERLRANLPSDDEVKLMQNAQESHTIDEFNIWDQAEEFLVLLIDIPRFRLRLEVWEFENSFGDRLHIMSTHGAELERACDVVLHSESIKILLGIVLATGNYLNGGTERGRADGFSLDFLQKVGTVKMSQAPSDGRSGTLTDYISRQMYRQYPEEMEQMLGPDKELGSIRAAARHNLVDLSQEVTVARQKAEHMLNKMKAHSIPEEQQAQTDAFGDHAETLSECVVRLIEQEDRLKSINGKYLQLCTWFHMEGGTKKTTTAEFFTILYKFLEETNQARKSLRDQEKQEAIRRARSAVTPTRGSTPLGRRRTVGNLGDGRSTRSATPRRNNVVVQNAFSRLRRSSAPSVERDTGDANEHPYSTCASPEEEKRTRIARTNSM